MFSGRPRRQMPPYPPARFRYPMPGPGHRPPKQNMLSEFRGPDGKLDIDKIQVTAKQVGEIYSQVSPMITKFIKK